MAAVTVNSPHTVRVTAERFQAALDGRGIKVFALVDHGAGAREAGLELPDEEVLIFGDPKVGTVLMQADARIGYELPLRVLFRDEAGQTILSYNPPTELAVSYEVGAHAAVLERMAGLLEQLAAESTSAA